MINDDIAFYYTTNHYMHQKGIIRKILFSIHSKFKLIEVYSVTRKKRYFSLKLSMPIFLNTLTNVLQFSTLQSESLNTIAPKILVVILVPFYEEEVPSVYHDRETSPLITMRGVRFQSRARFLLRGLAV